MATPAATASTALMPLPSNAEAVKRVTHTRLRRRLLYSEHEQDLDDLMRRNLGSIRKRAWGKVDLTANPYLGMWSQAAALYNAEPEVGAPDASLDCTEAVAELGFWPLMQRVQRDCLGLREMLVRPDVDEDTGELTIRPAFPDLVEAEAHPRRPGVPVRVREWVQDDVHGWICHDLSVRDPENPWYRVWGRTGLDLTKVVLGDTYEGADYPYRDSANRPYLPYVLYHAAETGCLFDPFTLKEIVEGSLNIGVLLTYYQHLVRNAAWAQRYVLDADIVGLGVQDGDNPKSQRVGITTDPAVVLKLRSIDGKQGSASTFQNPQDPEIVLRSISAYERRILTMAGYAPPGVTRQTADIRSGYALAVDRESIREQQRQFEPQFRKGDRRVLSIVACLSNRARGTNWSERPEDYRLTYRGLPKSAEERKAEIEGIKAEETAGFIGPVTAYMRANPGVEYEEAVVKLAAAALEKADLERRTTQLLEAEGIKASAPAVNLDVGKVQSAQGICIAAAKGELTVKAAREMLIALIGIAPQAATAITDAITPAKPAEPAEAA